MDLMDLMDPVDDVALKWANVFRTTDCSKKSSSSLISKISRFF